MSLPPLVWTLQPATSVEVRGALSRSRWPEENERCQRSLEQLPSWNLAQDTDKAKFAEHYPGTTQSTDITFPEGNSYLLKQACYVYCTDET